MQNSTSLWIAITENNKGHPHITSQSWGPFPEDKKSRKKLNQPAIENYPFGFVFRTQSSLQQIQELIKTKNQNKKKDNIRYFGATRYSPDVS